MGIRFVIEADIKICFTLINSYLIKFIEILLKYYFLININII